MPRPRSSRYKPRNWRSIITSDSSETTTPLSVDCFNHDLRRARRRKKAARGKGGSLRMLTRMPLDILYEIFGHLHPFDLLHVARTSQGLRAILMTRSSLSVWESAFSNVPDLPFCPSDLTLPQYSDLVFDEHCHFCLAENVHDVYWSCRVRCCKKCVNKYFVQESVLEQMLPDAVVIHRRETIFPYIIHPRPQRNKPGKLLYYLTIAEDYICELNKVIATDSEAALISWGKEKRIQQAQRLTHAALCETWSIHWVYHPAKESNVAIIAFLIFLLMFIWRDKIW